MLTPYTPEEWAKRMALKNQPGLPREVKSPRYAHENDARRNVRLKAERSKRQAARIDAYVTRRRRELAENEQTLIDVREPAWDDRRLPLVDGAGI